MFKSYQNSFLIAMPVLQGSFFERSVIYVCQHDDNGAMGIIINYQIQQNVESLLAQLNVSLSIEAKSTNLYLGGPVHQEHGFILHQPTDKKWDSSIILSKEVTLTTSSDILTALGDSSGPKSPIIAFGYAGWSSKQLDKEILDNDWMQIDYSTEVMFNTPPQEKWDAALKSIGISNPLQLSGFSGHA
jgi:putative transcriptional regulator